jgi:hypothetical protein
MQACDSEKEGHLKDVTTATYVGLKVPDVTTPISSPDLLKIKSPAAKKCS